MGRFGWWDVNEWNLNDKGETKTGTVDGKPAEVNETGGRGIKNIQNNHIRRRNRVPGLIIKT